MEYSNDVKEMRSSPCNWEWSAEPPMQVKLPRLIGICFCPLLQEVSASFFLSVSKYRCKIKKKYKSHGWLSQKRWKWRVYRKLQFKIHSCLYEKWCPRHQVWQLLCLTLLFLSVHKQQKYAIDKTCKELSHCRLCWKNIFGLMFLRDIVSIG